MDEINFKNNYMIIGFYRKNDPIIIEKGNETHPRIFIGYKDGPLIKKFGYGVMPRGRRLALTYVTRVIDYPIQICDINYAYMEDRDINMHKMFTTKK